MCHPVPRQYHICLKMVDFSTRDLRYLSACLQLLSSLLRLLFSGRNVRGARPANDFFDHTGLRSQEEAMASTYANDERGLAFTKTPAV